MKQILTALFLFFSVFTYSQGIIFYDDCEATNKPVLGGTNHNVTNSWTSKQGNSNGTIARSTTVARKGGASYRMTLTKTANSGWQWVKAELAWNFLPAGSPLGTVGDNTAFYRQPIGVKWIAFSTYIPASNLDFNTITSIGFNTKPVEDDIPTPTYLAMDQGRYKLIITRILGRTQTGSNANGPIYSYSTQITNVDLGPVVKDKWEDWVLERNYVYHDSGYVRFYKNKQLVAEYIGKNWPQDGQHSKEPYYQQGIYKWTFQPNNNPVSNVNFIEIFYDEFRFGNYSATLESMSPASDGIPNQPPIVSAGAIQNLSNSTTSTALNGSASDPDGTITTRLWTQLSGPSTATFSNTSINNPIISNLVPGLYKFRFSATDDKLSTSFAEVDIKINQLPITTLLSSTQYSNVDSIRLNFTLSDPDGTVTSILITQLSGPTNGTITNPTSITTDFVNLLPGDYIIRTSVTDNSNETAVTDWEIQVRSALRFRIRPYSKIKQ